MVKYFGTSEVPRYYGYRGKRVVSPEAQTRTNEANIAVQLRTLKHVNAC